MSLNYVHKEQSNKVSVLLILVGFQIMYKIKQWSIYIIHVPVVTYFEGNIKICWLPKGKDMDWYFDMDHVKCLLCDNHFLTAKKWNFYVCSLLIIWIKIVWIKKIIYYLAIGKSDWHSIWFPWDIQITVVFFL
jgi:hypothetical protein